MTHTRRDAIRAISAGTLSLLMPSYTLTACASPPEPNSPTSKTPPSPSPTPTLRACTPTKRDIEGPFFRDNAPLRDKLDILGEPGQPIQIIGRVFGPDCRKPLNNATLDVWQADMNGRYDEDSANYRLRGRLKTDSQGRYGFTSIRPGHYPLGRTMRPAHIHFTISAPGYRTVTTQLYFQGDPYLAPNDPCSSCASEDPGRIIPLRQDQNILKGNFDITLALA